MTRLVFRPGAPFGTRRRPLTDRAVGGISRISISFPDLHARSERRLAHILIAELRVCFLCVPGIVAMIREHRSALLESPAVVRIVMALRPYGSKTCLLPAGQPAIHLQLLQPVADNQPRCKRGGCRPDSVCDRTAPAATDAVLGAPGHARFPAIGTAEGPAADPLHRRGPVRDLSSAASPATGPAGPRLYSHVWTRRGTKRGSPRRGSFAQHGAKRVVGIPGVGRVG